MARLTVPMVLIYLGITTLTGGGGADEQYVGPLSASVVIPSIVNGWDAGEGRWPWQVSLLLKSSTPGYYYHTCGGVLLSHNFILSAAHCTQHPAEDYLILIGHYDYGEIAGNDKRRRVRNIINHPSYVTVGMGYDISLMELETPAVFTDKAQPALLPDTDDTFVGAECYISGWGKLGGESGVGSPQKLQELRIPVISNEDCRSAVWFIANVYINSSNVCVNAVDAGACQGDSGGPLHCRRCHNDSWVVAGVASWVVGNSFDTCMSQYPSVYTRISSFIPWILSITGNETRFPEKNENETCIEDNFTTDGSTSKLSTSSSRAGSTNTMDISMGYHGSTTPTPGSEIASESSKSPSGPGSTDAMDITTGYNSSTNRTPSEGLSTPTATKDLVAVSGTKIISTWFSFYFFLIFLVGTRYIWL